MNPTPLAGRFVLEPQGDNFVRKAHNIFTGEELRVKSEALQMGSSPLKDEYRVYCSLAGGIGVPNAHWFGDDETDRYLILDVTGPTLFDLLRPCNGQFSLKTALLLADQLITRLEFAHSHSILLDVTPDNFTMGIGKQGLQVFVGELSKAKRYRHDQSLEHNPYRENVTMTATSCYASINVRRGIERSRRDDMESLLSCSSLSTFAPCHLPP